MDADPDFASLKAPPASIFTQRAHAAKSYWISRRFCRGCTFNDANAAERRETQYFEMAGNRGIYHKGWTAVTRHRTPWETGRVQLPAFDDDVWELYDTTTDWSQSKDLAKENPEKLRHLRS